jgi:hypothetical protein
MVVSIAVAGLDLWFNSADHWPPHFHAERPGEWEVRVMFLRHGAAMIELVWADKKGPSARDGKKIRRAVEGARDRLLAEWEAKVAPSAPGARK